MDDEDQRRAYAAQMQALEAGRSGTAVGWKNPDSGRYGSVVPGPAYDSNGLQCRQYTHTIYIDGRPQVAKGNACRNPDGTWSSGGCSKARRGTRSAWPSALPQYSYSQFQTAQSSSFPRRVAAPGFCFFSFPSAP